MHLLAHRFRTIAALSLILAVSSFALVGQNLLIDGEPALFLPAGYGGEGLYLDRDLHLEEGESRPIINTQPLYAIYAVGERITGAVAIVDEDSDPIRGQLVTVELMQIFFYGGNHACYETVSKVRVSYDLLTKTYRFSLDTTGLEPAFYDIRFAFWNQYELKHRVQIGDVEFYSDLENVPACACNCGCNGE